MHLLDHAENRFLRRFFDSDPFSITSRSDKFFILSLNTEHVSGVFLKAMNSAVAVNDFTVVPPVISILLFELNSVSDNLSVTLISWWLPSESDPITAHFGSLKTSDRSRLTDWLTGTSSF